VTGLTRAQVADWVAGYETAWRGNDLGALATLFTDDARYRPSPYEPDVTGLDAIRGFWPEEDGTAFSVSAEVLAVDGAVAVVRAVVHYLAPTPQEYTDLWLLRFAADGRVEDFEEWAYWPGRPYSAKEGDD
jgi:ketosteroid isomerase-like protein